MTDSGDVWESWGNGSRVLDNTIESAKGCCSAGITDAAAVTHRPNRATVDNMLIWH